MKKLLLLLVAGAVAAAFAFFKWVPKESRKKVLLIAVGAGVVLFGLIQFIPIDRSNPPATSEPQWSSSQARTLVKENCFQCHSNETEWPWYSYIAPGSWLIKYDVVKGRNEFNFSEWEQNPGTLKKMIGKIKSGEMPPLQYTLFHPDKVLNDQQKQALIEALSSSIK